MPLDQLQLANPVRITMSLHETPGDGAHVKVQVNGVLTTLGPPWDGLALVASARAQGGYYVGNCGCGNPGCAGIWDPVQVRHDGDRIEWTVPHPYDPGALNEPGAGRLKVTFDAAQYRGEAEALLEALRKLRLSTTLCCYPTDTMRQVIAWADEGYSGHGGFAPLQSDQLPGRGA